MGLIHRRALSAAASHALLAALVCCTAAARAEDLAAEIRQLESEAADLRNAAAADPVIRSATAAPVLLYRLEQRRRRLATVAGLHARIEALRGDNTKEGLAPVLEQQLASLNRAPFEPVSFDSGYGYKPTTGLVGYSKRVRLLENTSDGKSIIQVDNVPLLVEGLGTSHYASGKFLRLDKAILVGAIAPIRTVQGAEATVYHASLVDLEAALAPVPPEAKGAKVVALWPSTPPGENSASGEEYSFELIKNWRSHRIADQPTTWLTNVSKPELVIFRPPPEKNTGVALVICPGGGYQKLGWDIEGEEVAAWANSIGLTGIILKYRCWPRPREVQGIPPLWPLIDAQRAISLVRGNADAWSIDADKIGIVGFSAGGHLAGAAATNFEARSYEPIDQVDAISCRPDFAVMVYSGYFKAESAHGAVLSPTVRATAAAPPLLFVHATDDPISDVEHSLTMYTAMKRVGVPAELHVYTVGGHGFGVRKVGHPCETWTDRCVEWLRHENILPATANR